MRRLRPVEWSWWRWLLAHTFVPRWVPARWRHPAVGYGLAVLLQIVVAASTRLLIGTFPTYSFPGLLEIAVVALIAVTWGAGPSLLATLVGVVLEEAVVVPFHAGDGPVVIGDLLEAALLLAAGISISLVTSMTQAARQRAEVERAEPRHARSPYACRSSNWTSLSASLPMSSRPP